MINFYSYYNGELDNQHYGSLITQLRLGVFTSDLAPIESIIKKDSIYAYHYAKQVIQGRWIEAESIIMKETYCILWYARDILKGRWVEAEPYINKDSFWFLRYKEVIGI